MREYEAWQRIQKAMAKAEQLGVKLDMNNIEGWAVRVRHFNKAQLDKHGDTIEELEAFLSGMSWGLRFAKFKMSGEE